MGIQHRSRPIFGTQWHPESVCSLHGQQIINNFRDIVHDFWANSTPWNHWTSRTISSSTSLSNSILEQSSIVKEARECPPLDFVNVHASENVTRTRPYYIKSVTLGTGPAPQVIFDTVIRNSSKDGEAWLDSARVGDPLV